jgi:LacI family transcriptional regulator
MATSPTVRQIAALTGVSRTTVSLALRNSPLISKETREKVLKAAMEQGYTINPVVSSLMNQLRSSRKPGSAEKLAYLTFWPKGPYEWRVNVNETHYFEGASERAQKLGYEIEHFWAKEPNLSSARLSKILFTRGIRGVILGPLPRSIGHISLDWRHFATAAVSLTIVKPGLHRASHGYLQGMSLALRTLKHRGYKRIGFANSAHYDQRVNHGWLSGYLTFQYQLPPERRIPPLLLDGWEEAGLARELEKKKPAVMPKSWHLDSFARWVETYQPDAIVSNTDHPYVLAQHLGLKVPQDVGFAQLHLLRETDPYAGIERLPRRIAAATVDLVVGSLQNNEFGLPEHPKSVIIEGIWRDGETIRPAKSEKRTAAQAKRSR